MKYKSYYRTIESNKGALKMRKFKNDKTGAILTDEEYNVLLRKEVTEMCTEAWKSSGICDVAEEFKEDGETLEAYIEHMIAGGLDDGFYYFNEDGNN